MYDSHREVKGLREPAHHRLAGEHLHGAPPSAVDLVVHHVLQPLVVRGPQEYLRPPHPCPVRGPTMPPWKRGRGKHAAQLPCPVHCTARCDRTHAHRPQGFACHRSGSCDDTCASFERLPNGNGHHVATTTAGAACRGSRRHMHCHAASCQHQSQCVVRQFAAPPAEQQLRASRAGRG